MSRFCKFGKLHVTKGNVDKLLGIVKDCNKALNDILQIMLQAEKYVASLAKSVQEYLRCSA